MCPTTMLLLCYSRRKIFNPERRQHRAHCCSRHRVGIIIITIMPGGGPHGGKKNHYFLPNLYLCSKHSNRQPPRKYNNHATTKPHLYNPWFPKRLHLLLVSLIVNPWLECFIFFQRFHIRL